MGPILAILSYVTRTYTKLIALMQKTYNPSYDAETDSNEAISEAVATVSSNVITIKNNTFLFERDSHSGSTTTTTYEQILYQDSCSGEPFLFGGGIVDLSNLHAGDKVTVKLWAMLYSGDTFRIVGQVKISGPLTLNTDLVFSPMYNQYGVKVGIIQTAGSPRSVRHEWFDAEQLG